MYSSTCIGVECIEFIIESAYDVEQAPGMSCIMQSCIMHHAQATLIVADATITTIKLIVAPSES